MTVDNIKVKLQVSHSTLDRQTDKQSIVLDGTVLYLFVCAAVCVDLGHSGPGALQERDSRLLQGRSRFPVLFLYTRSICICYVVKAL